jgi:hypothetical protein
MYHFNGSTTRCIADTGSILARPAINNNSVIWSGRTSSSGGNESAEIWLYDGSTTRLTNNNYQDDYPQINQIGQAVWVGWVTYESAEIFYYDGFSIERLTNNQLPDHFANINDIGYVVWQRQNYINYTSNYDIYLYDGNTTRKISNLVGDDKFPQINSNGHIVWQGHDGSDNEIFLYDGSSVTQLTNNSFDDIYPNINDRGYIVWKGYDGNDYEIYLYDGTNIIQITDNAYDDGYVSGDVAVEIDANGNLFWIGFDGSDHEVFMATSPPSIILTNPANNSTKIAVDTIISAKFSENMDVSTITKNTFSVDNEVSGSVSYDSDKTTATFTPGTALNYDTIYTATITTNVMDLAGNSLPIEYTWSFTTGPAPDTTPPDAPILTTSGTITDNQPLLGWQAVATAKYYDLEYSSSNDMTPSIIIEGLTASEYKIINSLDDGILWWRVRAIDDYGNIGSWSSINSIIIDTQTHKNVSLIPVINLLLFD